MLFECFGLMLLAAALGAMLVICYRQGLKDGRAVGEGKPLEPGLRARDPVRRKPRREASNAAARRGRRNRRAGLRSKRRAWSPARPVLQLTANKEEESPENERYNALLRNIDAYDGTGAGQEEV